MKIYLSQHFHHYLIGNKGPNDTDYGVAKKNDRHYPPRSPSLLSIDFNFVPPKENSIVSR